MDPVRLGIIGASLNGRWAKKAHLPAVNALTEVDLVAVATTRRESAEEARELYRARRAYADASELIADPDIEAVTVAVRVPRHRELVEEALNAGKHVYCEWPLTADTASAAELQRLADSKGLETIVGLQAGRSAPIRQAASMVAAGELGRLLSVSLRGNAAMGGATVAQFMTYAAEDDSGANLLTITTGQGLDVLCAVAGEFTELVANLGTQFPEVTIVETGERIPANSPDQVSVSGWLESGALATVGVVGGLTYEPGLRLEFLGETGALFVTVQPGISSGNLTLEHVAASGERRVLTPTYSPALAGVPEGPPLFVAGLYLDLVAAIRRGERSGPDFAHAVRRHRLLDAIRVASAKGVRQKVSDAVSV